MSQYTVEISIMDSIAFNIDTASSKEHAEELAIQYFKQDYPDLDFVVTSVKKDSEVE